MPARQAPQEKNIEVVVRCRPRNSAEKKAASPSIIECQSKKKSLTLSADKQTKTFSFDKVFGPEASQIEVYKSVILPIIEEVLQGYNCTVFAYGQTGTGKTYTMEGERTEGSATWEDDPKSGIIPRTLHQLFERLESQDCEFSVRVSFLELYNEEIFDLLTSPEDTSKLRLYEDSSRKGSVIIQGLEEVPVRSKDEVYTIMTKGAAKRQTAATLMNAHSSRSHSVFNVTVHMKENSCDGEELVKTGKFNLVDLAGSESIGRSGAVDKRAREAGNINQSLLTLGRVITALVDRAPHVPYRESKLTRLLQDSLGGRTKTCIIATVSPALINVEETISTLDYAHRAKNITNRPEVNQKLTKRALIKEYTEEIDRLKRDLAACRDRNGIFVAPENYSALTSQIEGIAVLETKVKALTTDLAEMSALFTKTTGELEECQGNLEALHQDLVATQEKLSNTKTRLRETKKDLLETRVEREKNKFLCEQHQATSEQLVNEGEALLGAVTASVQDVDGLQAKLDRRRHVDVANQQEVGSFREGFAGQVHVLEEELEDGLQRQMQSLTKLSGRLAGLLECSQQQVSSVTEQVKRLVSSVETGLQAVDTQQQSMLSTTQASVHRAKEDVTKAFASTRDIVSSGCQSKIVPTLNSIQATLPLLSETLVELQRGVLDQLSSQEAELHSFAVQQKEQLRALSELQESHKESQGSQLQLCSNVLQERMEEMRRLQESMLSDLCSAFTTATQKEEEHCQSVQQCIDKASDDISSMTTRTDSIAAAVTDCVQTKYSQATGSVSAIKQRGQQCQDSVSTLVSTVDRVTMDMQQESTDMLDRHLSSIECHSSNVRSSQREILTTMTAEEAKICATMHDFITRQESTHHAGEQENAECRAAFEHLIVAGCASTAELNSRVEQFFDCEFSRDVPTGVTPARRAFPHPARLTVQPHTDDLVKQFHDVFSYSQVNGDMTDDSFADLSSALSPTVLGNSRMLETPSPTNMSTSSGDLALSEESSRKENTAREVVSSGQPVKKTLGKSKSGRGDAKPASRPLGVSNNRQFVR
ncbi:kinesin-like protein KIF11 [Sycon ciliatum]|uniref:kinesin-like protein KIF11 n=1 Tax=Sycon ciliatum TaxID=27933 RepID=UPI0020AEE760|eukprot:scpid9207/ scgid15037/ Kinesin-like protein KIF11; Costal2